MINKLDTKKIRSYFLKALVASLVVAAAAGIAALLFGTFDDTEARVLLTTLLIGVYSVISLCCLTVSQSRYAVWGGIGVILASVSLLLGLTAIWWSRSNWETISELLRYGAIFGILGVSIGHQSLLLRIVDRTSHQTRSLSWGTVGAIGIVALMLVFPIAQSGPDLGESYWRLLGVFAILDVLGTIMTPIMARVAAKQSDL